MLALYLCLRVFCPIQTGDHSAAAPSLRWNGLPTIVAAAALLALAVGAKLYPLVLVPLLAARPDPNADAGGSLCRRDRSRLRTAAFRAYHVAATASHKRKGYGIF